MSEQKGEKLTVVGDRDGRRPGDDWSMNLLARGAGAGSLQEEGPRGIQVGGGRSGKRAGIGGRAHGELYKSPDDRRDMTYPTHSLSSSTPTTYISLSSSQQPTHLYRLITSGGCLLAY